jgi:para-nitrobenzyl esterase
MKKFLLLVLLCVSVIANAQNESLTIVNGSIQGATSTDKTVRIFKGIPFAAAPVGELRWKAPQPLKTGKA